MAFVIIQFFYKDKVLFAKQQVKRWEINLPTTVWVFDDEVPELENAHFKFHIFIRFFQLFFSHNPLILGKGNKEP
jgi:hypothetical protein